MFILKITGAVLLIFASSMYGFQLSNCYLKRIDNLKELKKCIILLDGELKYNNTPLRMAMKKIASRNQSVYSPFFDNVASLMENNMSMDVSKAWEDSINQIIDEKYCLNKGDLEKLNQFGKTMGNLDSESRKSAFEGYMFEIDMDVEEVLEDKDNKVKLFRTLGVMAGLFITVLII